MPLSNISFSAGAALAPMAGITDATMRRICANYGAIFTVSEMVSAKALTMKDHKSFVLMRGNNGPAPYGVQLFGHEADVIAKAITLIEEEQFDFLDLNMGCPAPKIVSSGAGSGLLRNPVLAGEIAAAAVKASNRPVTAKIRIGWDDETRTGLEVAKRLEDAGIKLITVHARTRAQQYTPGVDYDAAAEIKQALSIPVLFNGDITTPQEAKNALALSECDGVMVGRAAAGNPWLFHEIAAAFSEKEPPAAPSLRERFAVMDEQIRGMCEEKGEERAMREARSVAAAYMHSLRGASALRRQAHSLIYYSDLALLTQSAWEYSTGKASALPED